MKKIKHIEHYMHESLNSLVVLACILPLIVLTLYIFKKMGGLKIKDNQDIKIMNQISVGSKERILLIKVNEEVILLGVTPHQISTLHVCVSHSNAPNENSK